MSELDQLARSVEQQEAATEAISKIFGIMWKTLALNKIPPEYATRIIEKYIETTMKPQIPGNK